MNETYAAVWRARSRAERGRLVAIGRRGLKAPTPADAALVAWWSRRQLQRGPWPALILGLAVAIIVVLVAAAFAPDRSTVTSPATWAPGFVLYPGIALVGWRLRRPRLTKAVALNLGVIAGKTFTQPPDDEAAERLLAKAARKLK